MEPTQANPGRRDEQAPPVAGTLGQVVRAGRTAGHPIPVAVVVSIFDDLLAGDVDPPAQRAPDLDDVLIDQAGVARIDVAADLDAMGRLLVETLGQDVPPTAQQLIGRLTGADSDDDSAADKPADAAQLRDWIRNALGQPASRAEVVSLVMSVAAPLPVPEPVPPDEEALHDLETIPPNGALMAPLLGLGPSPQATIPTDPIRKRTIPVTLKVRDLPDVIETQPDRPSDPGLVAGPDGEPADTVFSLRPAAIAAADEQDAEPPVLADAAAAVEDADRAAAGSDVPIPSAISKEPSGPRHPLSRPPAEAPSDQTILDAGPNDTVVDPGLDPSYLDGESDAPTLTMQRPLTPADLPKVLPRMPSPLHSPLVTSPASGVTHSGEAFLPGPPPTEDESAPPTDPEVSNGPAPAEPVVPVSSPVNRPLSSSFNRPLSSPGYRPLSSSSNRPLNRPVSSSGQPTLSGRPISRGPESSRNRPVVRHQVRRDNRISVPVAPAARRTARQTRAHDSIMGPSDRTFPWGWLVVVGMVAAAAYYLLFT